MAQHQPQKTAQKTALSRRRMRARAQFGLMHEINVTPFVDVMLVLLIVFMVTAPLLTIGVPVELPETRANSLPVSQESPLTLTVDNQQRIFLQESEIELDDLENKLKVVFLERSDNGIFMRADTDLPYGFVMRIMGILNRTGFTDIGLVTQTETE